MLKRCQHRKITMQLKFSKAAQTAYKKKRKKPTLKITEKAIQKQANDLLNAHRIRYLRIEDWIWTWLRHNAPVQIVNELSERFGGMPDNVCLISVGNYCLALMMELKSATGKQHGKQKHWPAVQISRSPDETIEIVNQFIEDAEEINSADKLNACGEHSAGQECYGRVKFHCGKYPCTINFDNAVERI